MKTLFTILLLFFASLAYTQSAYVQFNEKHRAWIKADQQGDMLTIQGKFANDSPQEATFRYELITTRQGASGSSSSTQTGSFRALAQQEVSLSHVSINVAENDTYIIELKIFQDNSVYLHDKIEHQG